MYRGKWGGDKGRGNSKEEGVRPRRFTIYIYMCEEETLAVVPAKLVKILREESVDTAELL